MANHAKDRAAHLRDGTYRESRHAARVAQAVPDVSEDARLWDLIEHWQSVFEEGRAAVEAEGAIIQSATQRVPNPGCKVMKEASAEIRELCKVLGVGALNRARLGAGGPAVDEGADVLDLPPLPERGKRVAAKS